MPCDNIQPDPFYRRSGFWVAMESTLMVVYAAVDGYITIEVAAFALGAWATFFVAKSVRKSNSNAVVSHVLEDLQRRIEELRRVAGGQQ